MNNNSTHLSVVIPCFNEANNITVVIEQLNKIVNNHPKNIEIIVIDGGSTDNTLEELDAAFKRLSSDHFKLIRNKGGGYGGDIMKALSIAKGDLLAWTHADLQTDPADVITAYDRYHELTQHNEKIFIKGARRNRRFIKAFFTCGMQLVAWCALKKYLSDINAQPKLFSREFYEKYLTKGYPSDFSLDLFAYYMAISNGYQVHTFPVYFKKRMHGEAKGGGGCWKSRIKLIKRTYQYIFELRKKLL